MVSEPEGGASSTGGTSKKKNGVRRGVNFTDLFMASAKKLESAGSNPHLRMLAFQLSQPKKSYALSQFDRWILTCLVVRELARRSSLKLTPAMLADIPSLISLDDF